MTRARNIPPGSRPTPACVSAQAYPLRPTSFAFFILTALASAANNAAAEPLVPDDPTAFTVDAHSVVVQGDRVTFVGDAVLRAGPVRVRAARLTVRRLPDNTVIVSGPAVVAPCACENPPLAVGIDEVVLGPGARATLYGGTVRLFDHDTLPVPWLALRGPDSVGLLPPLVALRGNDGLLVGGGVFVPLARDAWLRLSPAAYLQGGYDLRVQEQTASTATTLRWDRLRGDLYQLDARGSVPQRGGALAWDADLLRGERGRAATTDLDDAARVYDRFASAVVLGSADAHVAAGVRGSALRGTGQAAAGPRVAWQASSALGGAGVAGARVEGSSLALGADVWHVLRADADLASSTWVGPARVSADARALATGVALARAGTLDGVVEARAAASLPFSRDFGRVGHEIEPGVALIGIAGASEGASLDPFGRPLDPGRGIAAAPMATLVQRFGAAGGEGASMALGAGALLGASAARAATIARAAVDTAWARGRVEGGLVAGDAGDSAGGALSGRLEVGPRGGLTLGARAAGRDGVDPVAARALTPGEIAVASSGWLSAPGWTLAGETSVPIGRAFTVGAGADRDLTAGEQLAERVMTRYHHPCGCLDVNATAAHRLGRGGVDAFVTLDVAH